MAAISFIVPVYNAERTLERCLSSLLGQDCADWTCLCVNDGSTDASREVAEGFVRQDSRFSLLNQENAGVAEARNRGLELVSGEYVAFADADDELPSDAVSLLLQGMREEADVVVGNIRCIGKGGAERELFHHLEERGASLASLVELFCFQYIFGKAYRTSFIREYGIRFSPLRIYEDEAFCTQALVCAERIHFLGNVLYDYRFNAASLTNAPGKGPEKKRARLRSAQIKQGYSGLAEQRGEVWKQALDLSCLESLREVFASLSGDPALKRELLGEAHTLVETLKPLPRQPRLWGYALLAFALRKQSPLLLDMARAWCRRFPLC